MPWQMKIIKVIDHELCHDRCLYLFSSHFFIFKIDIFYDDCVGVILMGVMGMVVDIMVVLVVIVVIMVVVMVIMVVVVVIMVVVIVVVIEVVMVIFMVIVGV